MTAASADVTSAELDTANAFAVGDRERRLQGGPRALAETRGATLRAGRRSALSCPRDAARHCPARVRIRHDGEAPGSLRGHRPTLGRAGARRGHRVAVHGYRSRPRAQLARALRRSSRKRARFADRGRRNTDRVARSTVHPRK